MTSLHDCTIRAAGPRDAAEVLVLARALATSYVVDETAFRAPFDGILADETNRVLVAEVGGRAGDGSAVSRTSGLLVWRAPRVDAWATW